jgi:hypothetical protein
VFPVGHAGTGHEVSKVRGPPAPIRAQNAACPIIPLAGRSFNDKTGDSGPSGSPIRRRSTGDHARARLDSRLGTDECMRCARPEAPDRMGGANRIRAGDRRPGQTGRQKAVGAGFEPAKGRGPLPVFKTGAFNHSATPPCVFGTARAVSNCIIPYAGAPVCALSRRAGRRARLQRPAPMVSVDLTVGPGGRRAPMGGDVPPAQHFRFMSIALADDARQHVLPGCIVIAIDACAVGFIQAPAGQRDGPNGSEPSRSRASEVSPARSRPVGRPLRPECGFFSCWNHSNVVYRILRSKRSSWPGFSPPNARRRRPAARRVSAPLRGGAVGTRNLVSDAFRHPHISVGTRRNRRFAAGRRRALPRPARATIRRGRKER